MKRAGYPILTISRNYSSGRVTISQSTLMCQEEFFCKTFQPRTLWHVWMTYYTPGAEVSGAKMLQPTASQELDLPPVAKDEAVIFNRGQQGYFRVRYDDKNILKLANLLMHNHTALDPVERAHLILDTSPIPGLNMPPGLATLLNPECSPSGVIVWWKMMEYFKKERNILPVIVSFDIFQTLLTLKTQFKKNSTKTGIEKSPEYKEFMERLQVWITSLVDSYFSERGWNDFGSSEESMMVHKRMLDVGCNVLELPSCIKFSQDQLLAWMNDPDKNIPLQPRGRVLFLGIAIQTMNERYDEIKMFIEGLLKIAEEKQELKKVRIPENSISLLNFLKTKLDRNKTANSSPLQESTLLEHGNGIDMNFFELERYKNIDAEEALKTFETGLGKIKKKYVRHLLKPLVSEEHLRKLEKIHNKMDDDTQNKNILDIETTNKKPQQSNNNIKAEIKNHLQKIKPFRKCLPMIIKTINSLFLNP